MTRCNNKRQVCIGLKVITIQIRALATNTRIKTTSTWLKKKWLAFLAKKFLFHSTSNILCGNYRNTCWSNLATIMIQNTLKRKKQITQEIIYKNIFFYPGKRIATVKSEIQMEQKEKRKKERKEKCEKNKYYYYFRMNTTSCSFIE